MALIIPKDICDEPDITPSLFNLFLIVVLMEDVNEFKLPVAVSIAVMLVPLIVPVAVIEPVTNASPLTSNLAFADVLPITKLLEIYVLPFICTLLTKSSDTVANVIFPLGCTTRPVLVPFDNLSCSVPSPLLASAAMFTDE